MHPLTSNNNNYFSFQETLTVVEWGSGGDVEMIKTSNEVL